jgi:hypothetical protein
LERARSPRSRRLSTWLGISALGLFTAWAGSLAARAQTDASAAEVAAAAAKNLAVSCAKLDDPKLKGMMDGLLPYLLRKCGRANELGQVRSEGAEDPVRRPEVGTDTAISDPTGDTAAASHTQSEDSQALNPVTGTICAAFNDSQHGIPENLGFSGFSRSIDGGLTWTDKLNVDGDDSGDPSMIWRKLDEKFYYVALRNGGLGIWRSDNDCVSFTFVSQVSATGNDDKELTAVDNNPASPNYGRMYVAWTDFTTGNDGIKVKRSSDGGATWSAAVRLSVLGDDVQGAWPAISPVNNDLFVSWVKWMGAGFPNGNIEVQVARSTDGGATFSLVTPPATNQVNPRDPTASLPVSSGGCGRPALNGKLRYLPSPQIAVGADGVLHAVYAYDPDATASGDVINVYYRRSTDSGATWGTEVQVNEVTTNDQFMPSFAVTDSNVVGVGWYDRRADVSNLRYEYWARRSFDGGVTWSEPSFKVSDVDSPIFLDPSLADCYHGDYDTQIAGAPGFINLQWSDDRNIQGGHNDPDIHGDRIEAGTDFLVLSAPSAQSVCIPANAVYNLTVAQFQGFTDQVTLTNAGEPGGSTVGFGTNPVTPPGSSVMTVNTAAASAGTSTITVTGTSATVPTPIVHTTDIGLTLYSANPAAPTLTAPAEGAINVPVLTNFTWSAVAQAATYELQVATDAGFTTIVANLTGLSGTTTTLTAPLATNTVHYWRVRAINTCGNGNYAATGTFTTVPAPGDCAFGYQHASILSENFELVAPTGWTHSASPGTDSWASSTARFHGGARSFKAIDPATVADQFLVTPTVALPNGAAPLSMTFWQHRTIEAQSSGTSCFDGGVVEISTDGGTAWARLEAEVQVDPYTGVVAGNFSNPIANTNAWCSNAPAGFVQSIVDLTAFAGQANVKVRFRLASDNSVAKEGWYIDDFVVQSCVVAPLFVDGFEVGTTAAWALSIQ